MLIITHRDDFDTDKKSEEKGRDIDRESLKVLMYRPRVATKAHISADNR